ncbi:ABC transporter substrate-binding protein [Paenibacillus marchantiophytorum]|uniref:ABC transporter substrate-binding protein n=1 Tax=Paenibacillus marchantiophytorum TaxID=1619310 RepID=A0ABQ1FIN2_9BACL|nr:ABC transporter substrate-binding protein [Paenibacillus marchantiophytorum]GGA16480.1 ABC transporter substrate-binding protein [Paenibacillus marchantiophytorum]
MSTAKKRFSQTIVSLFVLAFAAGCANQATTAGDAKSSSSPAPSPSAAAQTKASAPAVDLSKVTLRVGQTGWANLEIGFKEAGLTDTPYKLQFSVFQGGNLQLEAMAANNLDLGSTSEIPPIFASQAANGGNFKVIASFESTTLNQEIVVPKGSPIKSVAELKGKKVAYVNATTAHYFLVKILQNAGLSWTDVEAVPLSTSDGLSALISGKVDALASYGNAIISAHQNGATELASAKDILSGNFLYEATPDAISDPAKHAAIVDFLSRLNKFYTWTRNNQQKWAEITATNTKQPVEQALDTLKKGEIQRPSKISSNFDKAIASEQDVADALTSVGVLKNKIDVSATWSRAFEEELKKITAAP